jgi:IS1 family transposase
MKNVELSQFECDELWTFIKKKEKTLPRSGTFEPESGDAWIYTAVKRRSYLFIAFSVGKWTQQTCLGMVRKLAKVLKVPSLQCPLEVFTDGNDDYTYVLPLCFQLGLIDYGLVD